MKSATALLACFIWLIYPTTALSENIVPDHLDTWLSCTPKPDEPSFLEDLYINYHDGLAFNKLMGNPGPLIGPGTYAKDTTFLDQTMRSPKDSGYILGGIDPGNYAQSFRYRPMFDDLIAIRISFSGPAITGEPDIAWYNCRKTGYPEPVKEAMKYIRNDVVEEYIRKYHDRHHDD